MSMRIGVLGKTANVHGEWGEARGVVARMRQSVGILLSLRPLGNVKWEVGLQADSGMPRPGACEHSAPGLPLHLGLGRAETGM